MMMKVKLSMREAIIVLVIDLAIMGSGVIGLGLSPQVPVLLAITVTIFWAKFKGLNWDQINAGIKDGIDKRHHSHCYLYPDWRHDQYLDRRRNNSNIDGHWFQSHQRPVVLAHGISGLCARWGSSWQLFYGCLNCRDRILRHRHYHGLQPGVSGRRYRFWRGLWG